MSRPGTAVDEVVPYYTRLNGNILGQVVFDWTLHWSESEVDRVLGELSTITDEGEWYGVIS